MKYIERIAQEAKTRGADTRVKRVIIGLSYCMTELENGHCGLSFVFKDDLVSECNISIPRRPLAGSSAGELLDFAGQGKLANAIALSVANAVFAPHVRPGSHGDFIENFNIDDTVRVGMIGHFKPLEPIIKARGADLLIFDLYPDPDSNILESEKIPELLPACDVAIITATAIVNETIEDIFASAAQCSFAAMIGPSTPLLPQCFANTPINRAGGALVKDRDMLAQSIMEAGGMQIFHNYIRKVNITL